MLCLICAAVQIYWGGQDKQGQFRAENLWAGGNVVTSIFVLGPYALLAVSALIARRHRASRIGLVFAVVLCAITVSAAWFDHIEYLRTPPGRETTPMLVYLATIVAWIGGFIALVIVSVMSLAYDERSARRSGDQA
jgi:hypothetical protein